ncbi:MAG: hypothetical protein ACOYY5_10375, partial [Pseudomonadota bacterium]
LVWVGDLSDGGNSTAPNANGDYCADVTKATDAVFTQEEITFVCTDTDGDTFVDLQYCATWEQNASAATCNNSDNTGIDPNNLPLPGSPSKCNCDVAIIPIIVLPSDPMLTKVGVEPASRTEEEIYNGNNTFTFDLKVTNPNSATSLVITELTDNFGGQIFDIPSDVNASPTLVEDGVYLVSATDVDGQCLVSGSETIAPGATYVCTVVFKWHNLELSDTDTGDSVVREDKLNNFSLEWKFADSTPSAVGPSNNVMVSITDVPPVLTILKEADTTSIPESGGLNFDLVNYTVTFGSTSGWDTIHIAASDLDDTMLQNGGNETSGYLTGCSISGLNVGDSPQCPYSVNLATAYPTLNAGDMYKNTVTATPTDEEGTKGNEVDDDESVSVENVDPTVILKKYVREGAAASPDPYDPTQYNDTSVSVDEFELLDTTSAPIVTYLFEVENNSPETIVIDAFVDFAQGPFSVVTPTQVYDDNIANTTPVDDDCNTLVGRSLAPGAKEYCYTTFKVAGDESEDVYNIAWVGVSDTDTVAGQAYDTDDATVEFDPVAPDFALSLGVEVKADVKVTADTGNTEYVRFTPTADILLNNIAILAASYPNDNPNFTLLNHTCSSVEAELGPTEYYDCSFTVGLTGTFEANDLGKLLGAELKVKAKDNDDVQKFIDASVTFEVLDY